MGSSRVHIVVSAEERARFQAQAKREGETLSEWLREAGRARLAAVGRSRLRTPEDVDAFFAERNAEEQGREPDWAEHLAMITGAHQTPPS
jgi:hypothetical protein